tara:strand:- start:4213 stop:5550 length:1338 start_codon:yes stop_codon:yes gene_type:complete
MANIKFTYAATTLLSLTIVANSVSASNTFVNLKYAAAPATSISFTTELIPTRSLANQTVTMSDSTPILEVDRVSGDTLSITDTPVLAVDIVKTDSVSVVDTPNKIINSSIDFDLSDPDVDPDPVSMSDAPAMTVTPAGKTDSVTVADSPSKQPNKFPTDSITMAQAIGPFNIGKNPSDTLTIVESDAKTLTTARTDSVTMAELAAKTVTPAGKTDSITVADAPVKNITPAGKTDSVTMAESFGPFTIGLNPTDTVSATESIATQLTLGESDYLYPTIVSVFDGAETGEVKGYHFGTGANDIVSRVADTNDLINSEFSLLNDTYIGGENRDGIRFYNRVFEQDRFRLRNIDYSAQIANGDSLLNSAVMWNSATDGRGIKDFTGIINGSGLIGQPVVNSDTITYGDLVNAGLLVNFIYTDTSDSPTTGSHGVNGHFLNETPMGAGSH